MNNDLGEPGAVPDRLALPESPGVASGGGSIVFEAATQTPTSEALDSPLFTNKGYCLKNSGHSTHALGNIQRMRQHGQLCDIILKIGIEKFRAHKVVLASVSPYFFAMFNGDMKEQNQNEIAIHDMDATAVDLLLDYSYTGQITITADNVQVLLPASSLLQMQEVREACCRFLLRQLHPTNCLGIRSFADTHSCTELHLKSHIYALQNFQNVVATEEFLLLPFEEVKELISNGQLNISSEEDVFTSVLNWVKHDLLEREKYISKLMIHVRLPLVNREFLMTRVDNEKLIRDNNECRELLLEAMRYHLAPERRCALSSTRTMERKPKGADPYIFAIGGGSLFAIHAECEVYNPKSDMWHAIAPMQWRRSRSGVTGLRRLLYVVGGYDGASDLSTAECYNPLTNVWTAITPMGTKRSCLGICSFDGLIYSCGGYDGASCLSSMERFDPLTGIWCSCPAMNTRRRYCRISVVENCIFALGGFDSTNYQASVERFDPREGKWQSIPSMSSKRSSCGVAALDGHLYCVGVLLEMFAIVEFLDSDGESRGEISTVPLLWLSKKSTRCYWPYKTSGIPFPEFIKRLTPYKKSWPMYKIKLHATRDTYEAAEEVASKIISDEKENGDLTGESAISFTRKTIREASFGSSESSTDDSYIISETPKSQDGAVTREPLVLNQKHDLVLGTQTVDIENNTPSETQKPNKKTETSSGRQKIVMENNTSFVIQKTQKENKKAFTTLENNNTETDTNADTNTKPSRVNSPSNTSIGTQGIESPYIPSSSYSSISGLSGVSRNNNFEDMVLQTLAKIETNVEQNAIVIKELLQHHKLLGSNNLVRPENLPMLPIDDKEEFNTFEELLRKDKPVWDYLVRKLAAVGGSNIESFTRRIMCTLLTNKCATSFNWKGRDQKIAFSETKSVELINGNDGTMCMSSGERLNIRRMAWEPISAMHNRRATHEVVAINGSLYALGGTDGSSSLNSIEQYDPKSNKWTLVKSMASRRSSVGAAVLDCINIEHVLRQTVRINS